MDVNPARKRILVVDDELFVRREIAWLGEELGFEVAEADTAEQAIAKAPVFRPDIVVCDLTLGRSEAYFEGLRQIREAVGTAVPIVVYSGYASRRHEDAARQAGCSQYMCKPDPIRLRAVLQARA